MRDNTPLMPVQSDTIVLHEYVTNTFIRRQGRYDPLSAYKRSQIQGENPFPDGRIEYSVKHNVSRLCACLWRALGFMH